MCKTVAFKGTLEACEAETLYLESPTIFKTTQAGMALALFCYRAAHLHARGPHVEHVAGCGAGGTELPRLTLTCSFAVRSGSQKIFQSVLVQMH